MASMRRLLPLIAVVLACSACAAIPVSFPDRAYFPPPTEPHTKALQQTLFRAAQAAGDDPTRYSFALIKTSDVSALSTDEATFYFSEGLARLPAEQVDALVARQVAHEVMGHAGKRRALSLGLTAGFSVLGVVFPGLSLADFIVNPLVVRAFSREQEMEADRKTVEILGTMGHERPRRSLAEALRAAATVNGPAARGFLAMEPSLDDRLAALEPLEPPGHVVLRVPAPSPAPATP